MINGLSQICDESSRAITPENRTGEPGKGGMATEGTGKAPASDLGQGWKVSPSILIAAEEDCELARMDGPGTVRHIWLTATGDWRLLILRIYWDDQAQPSVESPLGDFFACGWSRYCHISSLAVCVNPANAFNCYWEMPFRKRCRITLANLTGAPITLYYQVDYSVGPVPDASAYFHAQFRRVNPLPYRVPYTILDGARGRGHYVGTYLAWGTHNSGWWGEGEAKFYVDGDRDFPTICGTGTEDYFCASYNFDVGKDQGGYREFSTPYSGLAQVIRPDGLYQSQMRFGMYRWHIPDPIRFRSALRVTIQALGWRPGRTYLPLQDDIASVAYWYQALPTAPFPRLPAREALEIN